MELTPQLFRDVQFTERKGAYDKDEVNAFLARIGTAVGQIQDRAREAQRRAEAAESDVARLESASREQNDADETLRRTLVLAQRTADAAIKEAQDEAEVILGEARQRADDMVAKAEEAIRRDVGAQRDRLLQEIRTLETDRDALRERIAVISDHLDAERTRLRSELAAIQEVLDEPSRSGLRPVPGGDHDPDPVVELRDDEPTVDVTDSAAHDDDDLSDLPPPPIGWDDGASEPSDTLDEPTSPDRAHVDDDDGGPPTEATPVVSPGTSFGGGHLDQLRRAVADDSTATGEEDAAMAAFFDQDTDEEPGRRFGRRR
ncbi:MAG: DivIVA domain-containing protein [Acidimicrobiales bacterium]